MVSAEVKGPYRPGGAYYTPLSVAHAIVGRWAPMLRASPTLRVLDPSVGGGAFPIALLHHGLVRPHSLEVMDLDPACRGMRMGIGRATVARQSDHPVQTGFLITDPMRHPDLVIGNPPFGVPRPPEVCKRCKGSCYLRSHKGPARLCPACKGAGLRTFKRPIPVAEEHIRRALEVTTRWVLCLLRLGMLEADERIPLWKSAHLRHVDILTSRPQFSAVCRACAGTGWGEAPGFVVPDCPACDGKGNLSGQRGTDATAYGAFLFDKRHTGPWTGGWLRTI